MVRTIRSFAALIVAAAIIAPSITNADPAAPVSQEAQTNPTIWPTAASPEAFSDGKTEAAIGTLIQRMTLEQKIGQLIQADISAIKPKDLARYPLGSVLAGGNSGPYGNERADAEKWRQLVGEFRKASLKAGAGVPILFGVDAVHGHSNLPGATIFPHNIGLGAAHDADLVRRIGKATAAEIADSGIEWTFAPTLAVPQDYRWGRTYEGYAADPALVASYARAMTLGLQGELLAGKPLGSHQVAATAKHFLADGGTGEGRDQGDARVSEAELIEKHAQGYPAAIDSGALTVMASFSSWNGVKHHGNKSLLTDVLKGRMGFAGLVVGDWNGHGQIPGCSATNCPQAINAGLDLFMAPDSWKGVYKSTLAAARSGKISMARIDDAVRRNLRVKFKLGLMGDTPVRRGDTASVGTEAHLALAREAVAKSLVLLKNNNATLPIKRGAHILVAGPGAENMAMQAGGWTISWQGSDTKAEDFPDGQTIGRALGDAIRASGGDATISAEGRFETKPDVAVVVLGEKPYAEFEGDVPDLAFRARSGEEELVARLKAQGIPVVIIFLSGRPMFAGKLINQADAFVAAWLPGTQGRGIADVLVAGANGKAPRDFTGRLPFAWPANARSPIEKPLFAAGYGLDYSRNVALPRVNEDPGISLLASDQTNNYLIRGKVRAPWRLVQDGSTSARPVDMGAQENAVQLSWNQPGSVAIEGAAVNLTTQYGEGYSLLIEWRIDRRGNGPLMISFGGTAFDFGKIAEKQPEGEIMQTRIPLRCFKAKGANLTSVGSVMNIRAGKGYVASLRTIQLEAGAQGGLCPK